MARPIDPLPTARLSPCEGALPLQLVDALVSPVTCHNRRKLVILLEQIVRVFERANEQDPTIPRLVPIATRRLFSRSSRKKAISPSSGTPGGGATGGTPPAEDDPVEDDDAPV